MKNLKKLMRKVMHLMKETRGMAFPDRLTVAVLASFLVAIFSRSSADGSGDISFYCSKLLQASKTIGTEGGEIELPPVKLVVPKGSLVRDTQIRLRRYPGIPEKPEMCSHLDRYSVEPFILVAKEEYPFRLHWFWKIDEFMELPDDEMKKWIICPKVSWTVDADLLACYSMAGLSKRHYGRVDSRDPSIIYNVRKLCIGGVDGCSVYSRGRKRNEFIFLTDRLSHFRLLPRKGDWRTGGIVRSRGGDMPGMKSSSSVASEKCLHAPDSLRRLVVYETNGSIFWMNISCMSNMDCEEEASLKVRSRWCERRDDRRDDNCRWETTNRWCERREGHCDEIGVCKIRPTNSWFLKKEPVCGCDGNTYRNKFAANEAGVTVRFSGHCEGKEFEKQEPKSKSDFPEILDPKNDTSDSNPF